MSAKRSGLFRKIAVTALFTVLSAGTLTLPGDAFARTSLTDLQNQINDLQSRVEALEQLVLNPDPVTRAIPMVCSNNVTADKVEIFYDLTIDPLEPILAGQAFEVAITATARLQRNLIQAAVATIPGLTEATITHAQATVAVRSGAAGGDVVLSSQAATPYQAELPLDGSGNVTDELEIPLGAQVATYIADGSGEVVFDFKGLAGPVVPGSPGETGTRAIFVVLQVGTECQSGTLNAQGGIDPLDDLALVSIPIK